MPKKILILYATAGSGHKKAAQAIFQVVKDKYPEARMADIVAYMPWLTGKLYSDGYTFLISRLPWLWGVLYFLSDTPYLRLINGHLRRFINARCHAKFLRTLLEEKPDVVISTQFLASEIVSYAKQKKGLETRLVTVVTDFGVHNFWLSGGTDVYCCASEMTRQILLGKGVPDQKIRVTGIPLDVKFNRPQDRSKIRTDLGLSADRFTVLLATGGIGVGPLAKIVELLKDDVQLLVICGHNKKIREELTKKDYPAVRAFGFIDDMERLMAASDLMVTKAGGLSVTEALAKGLPMVFFFLIPGQEMINAETLVRARAGVAAADPAMIQKRVLRFKSDPAVFAEFKKKVAGLAKPRSCEEIVSLI